MRILLDTADLEAIRYFNTYFPIEGVTTNPTILAKEGGDVVAQLKAIREIIGNKELHVQVTEKDFDKIIEEARAIVDCLGINTYVKIPVSDVGLRVTKYLLPQFLPRRRQYLLLTLARPTLRPTSAARKTFARMVLVRLRILLKYIRPQALKRRYLPLASRRQRRSST